jgi:long-chain acyl-CoA synthetase
MVEPGRDTKETLVTMGRAAAVDQPRPWLALYDAGMPHEFTPSCRNGVELFERGPSERPDDAAIYYFDRRLSFREAGDMAHAFATALRDRLGVQAGDRVALMLQNVPAMPIAMHATWLLGAIVTPVSAMLKAKELRHQLDDAGATVVVCQDDLYPIVEAVCDTTDVRHVVTVSALDFLDEVPAPLAGRSAGRVRGTERFTDLVMDTGAPPVQAARPAPGEPALLTYTSGTTGPAKGAINTHGGVAYNAETFQRWVGLSSKDVTVALAPLFHATGLIGHVAVSRLAMTPLLLAHRFDAGEVLRLIERWRGSWMLGPLTAFLAMLDHEDFASRDLSSLAKVCSGGAPVRPPVVERFERATGIYIHNMYGMTETTAPSHCVPMAARAPVDPETRALAVGVPVFGVDSKIVAPDTGAELPVGEVGEIVTRGPMVVPGYWGRPEETAHAIRDGWLHSGDLGKRDEAGWFYLVDRLKDQINASGYKVWPRDVEDVLLQHPLVRDAAVVGVPDEYRGETVKAFVVATPEGTPTAEELIGFCRERMAVYKAPRDVEFVAELPTNAAGKVLRRQLRDRAAG